MPPLDAASLEALSLAELRGLVGVLVAQVQEQQATVAVLRAENQALRDEMAWLKGLPPRPPPRPSGMERATEPGLAGKGGKLPKRHHRPSRRRPVHRLQDRRVEVARGIPSLLRADHPDYVASEAALDYMRGRNLAGPVIAQLAAHPAKHFADAAIWTAHLAALGIDRLSAAPNRC